MNVIAFANCCMDEATWLTNPYPDTEVALFLHTEGLIRLMKGYTITCQNVDPPLAYDMPILTPMDVSKIDAFIWSPICDECHGASLLFDTERSPYPIISGESVKRFPDGPLYHVEILKLIWKELDIITKTIPYRCVVTYPPTHLTYDLRSFRAGTPDIFKNRVKNLNDVASTLLTSLGWVHYELEDELAEDKLWNHFSHKSKHNLYNKIKKDLNI